jgi:hypothetical protein
MANLYFNKKKASFDEAKQNIIPLVIEATDGAFFIRKASNDCGTTLDVYAETDDPDVSSWSARLPSVFMGWRVIMYNCPTGYIGAFLDIKEVKDDVSGW